MRRSSGALFHYVFTGRRRQDDWRSGRPVRDMAETEGNGILCRPPSFHLAQCGVPLTQVEPAGTRGTMRVDQVVRKRNGG